MVDRTAFLGAVIERLRSPDTAVRAINVVAVFGSTAVAHDQVAAWQAHKRMVLSVRSIPGAMGAARRTGLSIAFADGHFAYLISADWPRGRSSMSEELVAAVTELYTRVHAHPLG